jgi:acetyl-CoA C-acetyltransferase
MTDAVILSACRTAIGTSFKGTLRETHATALAVPVVAEAVRRSGIDPASFDDVILAESLYGGGVLARYTALEVGMPDVPGVAMNRHCAGGLTSVVTAAANIRGGFDKAIVAGGVQSSSTAPGLVQRLDNTVEWPSESHRPTPIAPAHDMSITVGWNAAQQAGISREDMDEWAYRSHVRAHAARTEGQFTDEIIPLKVTTADGSISMFEVDEHPRSDTSLERLAALRVLHPEIEGFSITAGNSSGVNDAAAAVTVASSNLAARLNLTPLAVVRGWAAVGVEPAQTGTAAIAAIRKALQRTGLSPAEVDLWEINEAFASVPIAAVRALDLDEDRVNPWGSGCSLGHPVAASGTRMLTTLSHELARRGRGIAVAAMCAGGGMAAAVVIESA